MELIIYFGAFIALGLAAHYAVRKHESYYDTPEQERLRQLSR